MAGLLAWRNLVHDRSRFAVTLVGIVFAVVLIAMQLGLYQGFSSSTTTIIEHSRADLWIVGKGTRNFEIPVPIHDRELYAARSTPGVARAEGLVIQFLVWKKPRGGDESVLVVGFDLNGRMAGPWNLVDGDLEGLRWPDAVIADRLFLDKLGVRGVGDQVEINRHRARIVGLTNGVRSFTTSPWLFAAARTAQEISGMAPSDWNYVLVQVGPGFDPIQVRDALRKSLPRADVHTSEGLAAMTRDYWMFTTGAGASVLVSALLGLVVGVVIVAQVLYATTVDHLTEFGTLRAMGAPRSFVYRVIFGQAVISATLGYLIGIAVALGMAEGSEESSVMIVIPTPLAMSLFLVTLLMCVGASLVSIRKAMRIDPAMVFQR